MCELVKWPPWYDEILLKTAKHSTNKTNTLSNWANMLKYTHTYISYELWLINACADTILVSPVRSCGFSMILAYVTVHVMQLSDNWKLRSQQTMHSFYNGLLQFCQDVLMNAPLHSTFYAMIYFLEATLIFLKCLMHNYSLADVVLKHGFDGIISLNATNLRFKYSF